MAQGYGRIVMTTSTGVFGLSRGLSYSAAKAGVIGLGRCAAVAGEPHGIKVNMIAPVAVTRLAGDEKPDSGGEHVEAFMTTDAAAPMVGYLAHEQCPVSGEIFTAGAGRFDRIFIASTPGWVKQGGIATIEDIAANWDAITGESGYHVSRSLDDWMAAFMSHAA